MTKAIHFAFKAQATCPHRLKGIISKFANKLIFNKPFTGDQKRVLIIFDDNKISISQIYPFIYYWREIQSRYNVVYRCLSLQNFLSDQATQLSKADIVLVQTWFDVDKNFLDTLFGKIRKRHPDAFITYLDSFAPTDLRLAQYLTDHIDLYVKKHLLSDLSAYAKPTLGDTNLVEFYSNLYHLDQPVVDWNVPDGFAENIVIGPGFFTSPTMLDKFSEPYNYSNDRPIDIHSRTATTGSPWFAAMRQHAEKSVKSLSGLQIKTQPGVPLKQYFKELYHSKTCFSPFGAGEVCWRDIEAMMTGSVLVKPDMSHLAIEPDIFIPNETYVPVAWDYSDLAEKVLPLLADEDMRREITRKAYNTIRSYLREARFVSQMKVVFENSH